jgi:hypothetical protein
MEIGKKVITAGVALFCLGGLSVYVLMAPKPEASGNKPGRVQQSAMQAAIAQLEQEKPSEESGISSMPASTALTETNATPEMTHAAFLAEAEARREQNLENKAEAERLEKLRIAKQNSVECKFWKQQQKTSSAAAKIEEKINQYCNLPVDSSSEASSAAMQQITGETVELKP